jgi:Protein of unknown function (DUF3263)
MTMADTGPNEGSPRSPQAEADGPDRPHTGMKHLDDRSAAILAFERQWWARPGAKEEAIRRQFDLSPTMYYELLSRLIDDPAAGAAEPLLIKRLQQQRSARSRRPTDAQQRS